ncbi:M23 family metallopeptidase [Caulobacter segnis]|uniref:M23 family metallopeptidase n=1 Tax=Caulobacter segnis TaxID=88688 RepID=UPI00240FDD87|nr:M23 family metallopeptidase [Caulobacter segnis]MDG2523217.1 M23 family metallopeptidase [Caulobacter segnis]
MAGALAAAATPAFAASPPLAVIGRPRQGGYLIGQTSPRATISLDGVEVAKASRAGRFFIGFDRDAPPTAVLTVSQNGETTEHHIAVSPGDFDIQRIDGLPNDQVAPQDPALLARIGEEAKRKAVGFASLDDDDGFHHGFLPPLPSWRLSGRFGGQRILNGQPNRPHYGADLAAPTGTPVHAPAPGLVSFAETGLHFEGGLILIDHGQGVVSAYLHLSRADVRAGEHVRPGQVIGAVGQEGRATGPHLCWRLKWRGRNLDPMLLLRNVPL